MSKRFLALLTGLLCLVMSVAPAAAVNISAGGATGRGDSNRIFTAVYNDSGSAMTSGTVAIWDTGTDEAESTFGSYVTTTTTADSNLAAGVVYSDSILDQSFGVICVYGPIHALYANTTDGATDTAGTAIGTTTVDGQFGNGTGLGCLLGAVTAGDTADRARVLIFVDPSGAE